MRRDRLTFVDWLKLGEFLLRSVEPISDSGRPLPLVGEAVGVLLMRSGDTCEHCHEHALGVRMTEYVPLHCATWCWVRLLCMQCSAALCVVEECLGRMAGTRRQQEAAQINNGCADKESRAK
jgi:hypothetical protein